MYWEFFFEILSDYCNFYQVSNAIFCDHLTYEKLLVIFVRTLSVQQPSVCINPPNVIAMSDNIIVLVYTFLVLHSKMQWNKIWIKYLHMETFFFSSPPNCRFQSSTPPPTVSDVDWIIACLFIVLFSFCCRWFSLSCPYGTNNWWNSQRFFRFSSHKVRSYLKVKYEWDPSWAHVTTLVDACLL